LAASEPQCYAANVAPIIASLVLVLGIMAIAGLVGSLQSLFGGRQRIARWETAMAPDPGDPEGLAPVVRMIERELEAALGRAGTRLVNRTLHTTPDDSVHPPHITKQAWITGDIAGAGVTVSISPDMVTLNESRLEAQGYLTPESFCADAVATAMRMTTGTGPLAVGATQNWKALVGALILAAIALWVILALPAPAFVPK